MSHSIHAPTKALLPVLLAASATASAQTTWTVDLDPAAGADFLQIQPALDVAEPGDVVLVGPGFYERFDLTEGIRVIGVRAPSGSNLDTRVASFQSPPSTVRALPLDEVAMVADIDFLAIGLEVDGCAGTVVGDDVHGRIRVGSSADVRLRSTNTKLELAGPTPWLELGEPRSDGSSDFDFDPWLRNVAPVSGLARIHISTPRVTGTDGYASPTCFGGYFIDGTPAIDLGFGKLTVAGRAGDFVEGGEFEQQSCWFAYGASAVILDNGTIRHSGADIRTGDPIRFPDDIQAGSQVIQETPATADPSLRLVGRPTPGAPISLEVDGAPGDWVRLELGRRPIRVESNGSPVPRLVTAGRLSSLGPIPTSGTTSLPARIPANAKAGDVYWFQASTVTPDGVGRRTNSLAIVVRP